jgi:cysteine desulfurase
MSGRFYLDHNATTPLDPRVRLAMEPLWGAGVGNASSLHAEGRRARAAVDDARDRCAAWLKVKPSEIVFTGGGTESNNLAVRGLALAGAGRGRHLITCATEHHAVLQVCEALAQYDGFAVTVLPVGDNGRLRREDLAAAFRPDTILVSIMSANNETGVTQPMREIGEECARRGVMFHTDAVQSAGKEPLLVHEWQVAALSIAAHKFYGPVGAGLLYLKAGLPLRRLTEGGAHENERRPGTENAAALVGLAAAAEWAEAEREKEAIRQSAMVETLWSHLKDFPGIRRNGSAEHRIANTLNVSFAGLNGEELLIGLDLAGLAVSSGSACLVGSVQPSHVLQAMGVPPEIAQATVRFSLGKGTREEDIPEIARRVRAVAGHQQGARGGKTG